MKNIILLTVMMVIISCSNDIGGKNEFALDTSLDIYLKNSAGENLLNTPEYNSENFRIYNVINGQTVEVYDLLMDAPRNFFIITETNPISMRLFLNLSDTELFPITYIKWNETDTDTLKAVYRRSSGYTVCDGVWLNDDLVWPNETNSSVVGRQITIVK